MKNSNVQFYVGCAISSCQVSSCHFVSVGVHSINGIIKNDLMVWELVHFSRHDLRFIVLKCSRDGINEQSVSTYAFISNVSARNIRQNKFKPSKLSDWYNELPFLHRFRKWALVLYVCNIHFKRSFAHCFTNYFGHHISLILA